MELIDREKLKASIRSMVELPNEARAQVIGAINRAKAIDIVRCKDCQHCKKYRNRLDPMLNHQLCVRMDNYAWGVEEDDFCSYGERRTGES